MLKLENVHIRRGDYVVADSIDLTLEQGKVYSVLGPNGTGKSSLMKTIFGEVAHKGTIRYGDEVLSKIHLQSWRKRIGYMPQDTAADALAMVEAGANRLGLSASAAVLDGLSD